MTPSRGGIAAVLGLVVLTGCGGGLSLRLDVFEPAVIPAHVFPRVVVRGTGSLDAEILAEAVVADLRGRGIDAREIGPAEALDRHLAVEGATLLVEIHVERSSTVETRRSVEAPPLSPYGSSGPVERFRDVTVLGIRVELAMSDARTGTAFDAQVVERTEDEEDMGASGRLLERAEARVIELFQSVRGTRDVPLAPLTWEAGRAAIDDARAGRIGEAVEALRALRARVDEMSEDERAAFWFDLGQVLRVAALDDAADVDAEAHAAFDEAMSIRPDPRVADALEALEEETALRARIRAEDAAYAANRGEE